MNKSLILITILILLYLYWKAQSTKPNAPKPDDLIERKGKDKELFYEAEDFDLNSEENQTTNKPPLASPAIYRVTKSSKN